MIFIREKRICSRDGKQVSDIGMLHKNLQKMGTSGTNVVEDVDLKFRFIIQKVRAGRRKVSTIAPFKHKITKIYINHHARKI